MKKALFFALAAACADALGQHEVVNISYDTYNYRQPSLKSAQAPMPAKALELPFYEDFSSGTGFPSSSKWEAGGVFVNDCFSDTQPSIGLATFDALDSRGMLYTGASSAGFGADTLASLPILLGTKPGGRLRPADSVAISFYYQIGGLSYSGSTPTDKDSLFLELYYPGKTQGVFINELSADSLEIYNGRNQLKKTNGDSLLVKGKYGHKIFAIDTSLAAAPYGHIVIKPSSLGLPADLPRWTDGDTLVYLSREPALRTEMVYYAKPGAVSMGRAPDGSDNIEYFYEQSMGRPNGSWAQLWFTTGLPSGQIPENKFNYIKINITDAQMLTDGARLRFRNTATISNDPSHARSAGIFNLDHIYVGSDRAGMRDIPDVAFSRPMPSFMRDYQNLPYWHISARNSMYNWSSFNYTVRNFDTETRKLNYGIQARKLFAPYTEQTVAAPDEEDLNGRQSKTEPFAYSFYIDIQDFITRNADNRREASYELRYFFNDASQELPSPYRRNDTISRIFSFQDYYAYDDGTSEAGYGLRGETRMSAAQKFTVYKEDTLRAVSIHFNPTANNPLMPDKRFFLAVWADNSGRPGELLYYSPAIETVSMDRKARNYFQDFAIQPQGIASGSSHLTVSGDIHVGWVQVADFLLNVGLDLNNTAANKISYKVGADWEQGQVRNPMMIRLKMGSYTGTPASSNTLDVLHAWPNPASGQLCTNAPEGHTVSIIGAAGISLSCSNRCGIDISGLSPGIYCVMARCSQNGSLWGKPVVIAVK
jgi:hypothetical protein